MQINFGWLSASIKLIKVQFVNESIIRKILVID
jgi:hypothetical protein